ncbi:hypothetical protein B0H19DRAFT_1275248 [Mycena capillaripes]|nr:hypothetical protein B0H19DRAFT_1275248 [Mycena capillaripes]
MRSRSLHPQHQHDSHPTSTTPVCGPCAVSSPPRSLVAQSPHLQQPELPPLRDHYSPHAPRTPSNTRALDTLPPRTATSTPQCWSLPSLPITNTAAFPPHAPPAPYAPHLFGRRTLPFNLDATLTVRRTTRNPHPSHRPDPARMHSKHAATLSAKFFLIASQFAESLSNFGTFLLLALSPSSTSAFQLLQ